MLIVRFLRCNRADFLLYAGAPLAVFLLGLLVNAGAVLLFRAESTFVFLPLFLAMVCALLGLSAAATSVLQAFPMALSFSVTRRSALLGVVSYTLLAALVLAGLSLLVSWADRAMIYGLFPLLRPGLEVLGDPLYEAGPLPIVAAALGGALAGFVGGAAIQRFGRRAGWALWGIYMAVFLLRDALPLSAMAAAWPLWIGVTLLLVALSVWSLLRAVVRS